MKTLLLRSAVQARYVLLGASALCFLFQLIIVGQAAEIERTQSFSRLANLVPVFLQRGLGSSVMQLATFRGIVAFGYFHPVMCVLVAVVAIYVATEPAHEIESRLVDLELARSLPRHRLLTRSLIVSLSAVVVAAALMYVGTETGAVLFGAPRAELAPPAVRARLLGHLAAVAACFAGIGLWLGASSRRWTTAFTTGCLVVVAAYLVDFLAIGWPPMRRLAWISPFHYYPALSILAGDAPSWRNLIVLLSAAAACAGGAYWRFARRDL